MKQLILLMTILISLNGLLFAQNPFSMALSLDGDGDQVSLPSVQGSNSFTIEAWVFIDTNYSSWRTIYSGSSRGFFLKDKLINWWQGGDRFLGGDTIPSFEWHHIALAYNDTNFFGYLDSILDTMSSYFGGTLPLGAVGIGGHNLEYFDGLIDELRIWNFMRSQTQIHNTMGDTLGPVYYSSADSGLIAYWRFDELEDLGINGDGADDVRDYSIYGSHGDLVGDATLDISGAIAGIELDYNNIQLKKFTLSRNYPNPFNPTTKIKYSVPQSSNVAIKVYDVLGNEVATLVNEEKPAGRYEVEFSGAELTSGIYFYQIKAGSFVDTKKMILMK
ncbi:MAG: T9SS type A sorting domain-containing protein [Ignavibacteriaceae bacterium]|nr:T9SS type A sorting domain-containing protein [Ignavibacteriaceae bacterium]